MTYLLCNYLLLDSDTFNNSASATTELYNLESETSTETPLPIHPYVQMAHWNLERKLFKVYDHEVRPVRNPSDVTVLNLDLALHLIVELVRFAYQIK